MPELKQFNKYIVAEDVIGLSEELLELKGKQNES